MSVVPTESSEARARLTTKLMLVGLRLSLVFTPRPTTLAIRSMFERSGAARAARQLAEAPDVRAVIDESYGPEPDNLLDVYTPKPAPPAAPPVVVWIHGGAFVGGSKEELGGYLRTLAARGFATVAVGYTRAPEGQYPTPVRQVVAALGHLTQQAERLGVDAGRIVLAGDSAGAQISAQVAAVCTNSAYADRMGMSPRLDSKSLRGIALCCGIFDLAAINEGGPFKDLIKAVGWAYSGTRHFRAHTFFTETASVTRHLTNEFPPTFVTAGNADPLLPQSIAFARALEAVKVDHEVLFFPKDHEPALGHEYQFDLDTPEGWAAFERLVAFFGTCTQSANH
jgi:acetyl esterase